MKKTIIAALALVGTSAWACPNLTGNYVCTVNGQQQRASITQQDGPNGTTYSFDGDQFVANGQVENLPDDAPAKNITRKFWCEGDLLRAQINFDYVQEEVAVAKVEVLINLSLTPEKNLTQVTGGTITDTNSKQVSNIEEEVLVCTRQ